MTQENKAHYQTNPIFADDLTRARWNLQRNLDIFGEGPQSERVLALGLRNLYLSIADPSVETIEQTISGLTNLTFDQVHLLHNSQYNVGWDPEKYFSKYGIDLVNPEALSAGISNSSEVIGAVFDRFDTFTQEIHDYDGGKLDPRKLAEEAYAIIQIKNGERRIEKATEQVRNEPSIERRYRKALVLKSGVMGYATSHPCNFGRKADPEKPVEPTWKNLTGFSGLSILLNTESRSMAGGFGIGPAIDVAQASILRRAYERKLDNIPPRDKEKFDKLRLQYGAKAANLLMLSELVTDVNKLRNSPWFGLKLAVPNFSVISVDTYKAWREGTPTDDELYPYFEWVNGLKDERNRYDEERSTDYMVRSSAVFSEDGEHLTGAGIYDSERVFGGSTFKEFKKAVAKVYESTNSPHAQSYRKQNGITEEEMGLIVQRYVSADSFRGSDSKIGYVNSRLNGVPQLMEIVTGTSRNFVQREGLDFFLALEADHHESAFRQVHHFPPDMYKMDTDMPIELAQLTFPLERIWGHDVQIEFIAYGSTYNFVQIRDLPTPEIKPQEIIFPDKELLQAGAAIGIGDMELPVLDNESDNTQKKGVVMIFGNHMWSWSGKDHILPKEGAVILINGSGQNGHVQTICAEQGLICIFPDPNSYEPYMTGYDEMTSAGKIRIVSNGIEGRIYKV